MQGLEYYVFSWIGAIGVMLLATPVVMMIVRYKGWVAKPQKDRWHEKTTALMGGIAIYFATTVTLFSVNDFSSFPWAIWAGGTIMFVTGFIDDIYGLGPLQKLIPQFVATTLLVFSGLSFGADWPLLVSLPITFFWVVGITNAVNLLDNMDGLSAGVSGLTAGGMALFLYNTGNIALGTTAVVLSGAALGFLFFNFKPAKIFMGDCGSMFLGFVLAGLAMGVQHSMPASFGLLGQIAIPLLFLAVPILDTTVVSIVRTLNGRSISQGGRDHVSHRLVFSGMADYSAVLFLYSIVLIMSAIAISFVVISPLVATALALVGFVALSLFGESLGKFDVYDRNQDFRRGPFQGWLTENEKIAKLRTFYRNIHKTLELLLIIAGLLVAFSLFETGLSIYVQLGIGAVTAVIKGFALSKTSVFESFAIVSAGRTKVTEFFLAAIASSALLVLVAIMIFDGYEVSYILSAEFAFSAVLVGLKRYGFGRLIDRVESEQTVIVYGAGSLGVKTAAQLSSFVGNPAIQLAGFIDDKLSKGNVVNGVPVLADGKGLANLIEAEKVGLVLLASKSMGVERKKEIERLCESQNVVCKDVSGDSGKSSHLGSAMIASVFE